MRMNSSTRKGSTLNNPVRPEPSLSICFQTKVTLFEYKIYKCVNNRYGYLDSKYAQEGEILMVLGDELKTLKEKIENLHHHFLSITINPTCRSEPVIIAIIENMSAQVKKVANLFAFTERRLSSDDYALVGFQNHSTIRKILGPSAKAELLLPDLCNRIITHNEMLSSLYETTFKYVCIFEGYLNKIFKLTNDASANSID